MTKKATKSVESIIHQLEVVLRECKNGFHPVLRVNNDWVLIEEIARYKNAQFFDRICGLEEVK